MCTRCGDMTKLGPLAKTLISGLSDHVRFIRIICVSFIKPETAALSRICHCVGFLKALTVGVLHIFLCIG